MQKGELIAGKAYALRNRGEDDETEPFVKVTYLGTAHRDKVKVTVQSGRLAGIEDWVHTRQIECPWGERKALLRDEERLGRLREQDAGRWDAIYVEALDCVMTASGEYTGFLREWRTDPESARRFWARGGLNGSPLESDPFNFADRNGEWHLSLDCAVEASKAFAAAEPELVELYIAGWEDRLKAEGWEPGNRHSHDLLRDWAPSFALARSWMQRPATTAANEEIVRLRKVVNTAVIELRRHGHEGPASRIERALRGR